MIQPAAATPHTGPAALAACVPAGAMHSACGGPPLGVLVVGGILIVYLAVLVLSIVAWVKIVTKAGYSGWWVLVTFVPVLNFVMMLVFAFSRWPALAESELGRARSAGTPGYGPDAGWGGGWPPGGTGLGGAPQGMGGSVGPGFGPGSGGRGGGGPGTGGPGGSGPAGTEGSGGFTGMPSRTPVEAESALPSFWNFQPAAPAGPSAAGGPAGDERAGGAGGQGATNHPAGPIDPGRPAVQPSNPPAGWYPTPDGRQRYWDGTGWTHHFA